MDLSAAVLCEQQASTKCHRNWLDKNYKKSLCAKMAIVVLEGIDGKTWHQVQGQASGCETWDAASLARRFEGTPERRPLAAAVLRPSAPSSSSVNIFHVKILKEWSVEGRGARSGIRHPQSSRIHSRPQCRELIELICSRKSPEITLVLNSKV